MAEFSGSERTVAEYLLAEMLAQQAARGARPAAAHVASCERVISPLANCSTGGTRSERDPAGARGRRTRSSWSLDVCRSWFRYHHLLADLLRLELRREAPGEIAGLHRLAAGWYAEHGHAVPAIRHAAARGGLELATELLGRHWVHLVLDGEEATLDELLSAFPAGLAEGDAELASIMVADRLGARAGARPTRSWQGPSGPCDLPDARRDCARTALATTYRLLEGRGLPIQHFGEPLRLAPGAPVVRPATTALPGPQIGELPRAA